MTTAVVTWDLPTTRESGGPITPEDISGVQVSLSSDGGATFIAQGNIFVPNPMTISIPNLDDGTYIIRLVVVAKGGVRSANSDTPFTIVTADTSPPSTVQNVIVVTIG
jgi:hypothetical protein